MHYCFIYFQYILHYIFIFLIFQYINNDLLQKIAQYDPTAAEDHQLIPPEKIEVYLKGITIDIIGLALGLSYSTPLLTIFQLYHGLQFY